MVAININYIDVCKSLHLEMRLYPLEWTILFHHLLLDIIEFQQLCGEVVYVYTMHIFLSYI